MDCLSNRQEMERMVLTNTILFVFALVNRSSSQSTSDPTRGNCVTDESIHELRQEIQTLRQTVQSGGMHERYVTLT